MANQPPAARPFIRLPYFGRQPAQPPPSRPAPAARPPIMRGGFAQALRPTPPQLQPPAPRQPPPPPQLRSATPSPPPPSTPKRSPISSPIISSPSPTTKSPMASPTPSPTTKTFNLPTPRGSPKSAQSSPSPVMSTRSPSPMSLPPSQLQSSKGEVEHRTLTKAGQQTVVDKQVVYATPKGSPVTKGFANTYKEHNGPKNNKDGEGVVTMAGENKGAVMELGHGRKFSDNVSNESGLEEDSDEEDNGRGRRFRRMPRNAYVNSNVQGVNDSILYNCSISHHDPGVHFSLSRNGYSYSHGNGIKHHGSGKQH